MASGSAASGTPSGTGTLDLYGHIPVSWQDALQQVQSALDGDVSKIELEAGDTGKYHYKTELLSDSQGMRGKSTPHPGPS